MYLVYNNNNLHDANAVLDCSHRKTITMNLVSESMFLVISTTPELWWFLRREIFFVSLNWHKTDEV